MNPDQLYNAKKSELSTQMGTFVEKSQKRSMLLLRETQDRYEVFICTLQHSTDHANGQALCRGYAFLVVSLTFEFFYKPDEMMKLAIMSILASEPLIYENKNSNNKVLPPVSTEPRSLINL